MTKLIVLNNCLPISGHIPVLINEVLQYLDPQLGQIVLDCTLGGGGHSRAIWQKLQPGGQLIGIDQDLNILNQTKAQLAADNIPITAVHRRFDQLREVLDELNIDKITGGLLADIGVSSFQLDQGERGFSFSKEAPLDMRMDQSQGQTAEDIVNTYSEADLIRIFSDYGEERLSKTIARNIVSERKKQAVKTTIQLAGLIDKTYEAVLGKRKRGRIHNATCVFQALRIEVNDELGALERLLDKLPDCLESGAKAVFIAFHSLEDRIIKRKFRNMSKDAESGPATFKLLTKKPVMATEEEIKQNPRARSAKLRAVLRV